MSDALRFSVALVTRNRPESLKRCLASARAQSEQPHEIVVSDDSDPEFAEKNRELARRFDCRWIAGPRRGLYANRNAAALACSGTHIRTMDDDHTFPAGHFKKCFAAARSDPDAIWTTGEIGFVDGKYFSTTEKAGQLCAAGVASPVPDPDDNWAIADGATIYPRAIFDRGFRMVEEFGFGAAYLEFGAFLYAHGFRSRCVRGVMIEHHATTATLARRSPRSTLFASICFNAHFRPNRLLLARYVTTSLLRSPRLLVDLRSIFSLASSRWAFARG